MKNILRKAIIIALAVSCVSRVDVTNNEKMMLASKQKEETDVLADALKSGNIDKIRAALSSTNPNRISNVLGRHYIQWALATSTDAVIDLLIDAGGDIDGECVQCKSRYDVCGLMHTGLRNVLIQVAKKKYPAINDIDEIAQELFTEATLDGRYEDFLKLLRGRCTHTQSCPSY